MHTSKKEVRAQNAHRDLRPACPRRRYARVRHHYHRAGQNAHRDPRPACRRANDSQIVRDLHPAFRHSMDEKLLAKTCPEPTSRAPLKWIHPATVRAQSQQRLLQTHQEPRPPEWTNAVIPHQSAR
jgi:hypothetical protein